MKTKFYDREKHQLYIYDKVMSSNSKKRYGSIVGLKYDGKIFVHWNNELKEEDPYDVVRVRF